MRVGLLDILIMESSDFVVLLFFLITFTTQTTRVLWNGAEMWGQFHFWVSHPEARVRRAFETCRTDQDVASASGSSWVAQKRCQDVRHSEVGTLTSERPSCNINTWAMGHQCHLPVVSRYTWDRNYSYDISCRHPAAEVEAIISCFKDGYSPGHEARDAFGGIPKISWLSYAQFMNLPW